MATATIRQMSLVPVDSSNLAAAGYDRASQTLRVLFKSGHMHDYVEVPPSTWGLFQKAESKGKFYAAEIRGKFVGEKMTGSCESCGDLGPKDAKCDDCGVGYYRS